MYGVTDYGEEYGFGSSYTDDYPALSEFWAIIYDDAEDDIQPAEDIDDINTQPKGASYSRATVPASDFSMEFVAGQWYVTADGVTFDGSDSSRSVQSYGIGGTFQASGDNEPTDHLLGVGPLGGSVDLSTFSDTVSFDGLGPYDRD